MKVIFDWRGREKLRTRVLLFCYHAFQSILKISESMETMIEKQFEAELEQY